MTPSSLIMDRSANSRIVEVSLVSFCNCNSCEVSRVTILIAAPKSTRTQGIIIFPICIETVGWPRSPYLTGGALPDISVDKSPITWTVRGSLIFLPGFLTQMSHIVLA
jgi:hypothetical protein